MPSFSTTHAISVCAAALLCAWCFDSAQAQPPARSGNDNLKGWRTFSSREGAFSVRFPAAPKTTVRGDGKQKVHAFYHAVPGGAYIVSYGNLRENGASTRQIRGYEPQGMLDSNLKGMLQGAQGVLVSQKRLQWQGFPARAIVYDIPKLGVRAQGILVYAPPFLYQAFSLNRKKQAALPSSLAKVRAFINSFQTRAPRM